MMSVFSRKWPIAVDGQISLPGLSALSGEKTVTLRGLTLRWAVPNWPPEVDAGGCVEAQFVLVEAA